METANEETIYKKIVNVFLKNPKVTGTVITLLTLVFFGAMIYFPSKFSLKNSEDQTPTKNSLKFNLPNDSSQNQGAVQGAGTQSNGPEEQSPSNSPSQEIAPAISASPSAQTITVTPSATPTPTATNSSEPTATATPTASPTPTATSEPTPTSTEITPAESPTLSPTP
jgi:hypothetical protein